MPKPGRIRRYRAAGGIVVDAQGQHVLVLVRSGRLGPNGRSEVRLPKGHIEENEQPAEAAVREVKEESGLDRLALISDLGNQTVSFVWDDVHYTRNERYFLFKVTPETRHDHPEPQFRREWMTWNNALKALTFEAEREWVRRGIEAWQLHANSQVRKS